MGEPDDDYFDDDGDDDFDEFDRAAENCGGFMDAGVFMCGHAGSEDCDWECPFSRDLGLTLKQIERRDLEEMEKRVPAQETGR